VDHLWVDGPVVTNCLPSVEGNRGVLRGWRCRRSRLRNPRFPCSVIFFTTTLELLLDYGVVTKLLRRIDWRVICSWEDTGSRALVVDESGGQLQVVGVAHGPSILLIPWGLRRSRSIRAVHTSSEVASNIAKGLAQPTRHTSDTILGSAHVGREPGQDVVQVLHVGPSACCWMARISLGPLTLPLLM
jgi:hypothetical protein